MKTVACCSSTPSPAASNSGASPFKNPTRIYTLLDILPDDLVGNDENSINLVFGVPNDILLGSDEEVQTRLNNIKGWLTGEHHWEVDGKLTTLKVHKTLVTSQAAGGLFDYVLDPNGKISKQKEHQAALKEEVGIISIGFKTVEFLVLRERKIMPAMTGSTTNGVRRLLEILDPDRINSIGELDLMLRAKRLHYKDTLPVWSSQIKGDIEKFWGTAWQRFEKILVFGGGAALLQKELILHFRGKMWMPENPTIGIARG